MEDLSVVDDAPVDDAPHLYLTVADEDENQVLELVKVDETGMFVRDNESWVPINPNADNPRVWDRIIIDVTEEAVSEYDLLEANGSITADQFEDYKVPEGAVQ